MRILEIFTGNLLLRRLSRSEFSILPKIQPAHHTCDILENSSWRESAWFAGYIDAMGDFSRKKRSRFTLLQREESNLLHHVRDFLQGGQVRANKEGDWKFSFKQVRGLSRLLDYLQKYPLRGEELKKKVRNMGGV